jgi:hypothetical protein
METPPKNRVLCANCEQQKSQDIDPLNAVNESKIIIGLVPVFLTLFYK